MTRLPSQTLQERMLRVRPPVLVVLRLPQQIPQLRPSRRSLQSGSQPTIGIGEVLEQHIIGGDGGKVVRARLPKLRPLGVLGQRLRRSPLMQQREH